MERPYVIISLDTELLWGPEDISTINFLQSKNEEIRKAMSYLLKIFEKYNIPVTWAIVGHLFLEQCNRDTCLTRRNKEIYNYQEKGCPDPYSNLNKSPLFYGRDIVEEILSNNIDHEIGYHSFSHPTFTEISREMAKNEIAEAKKIEKIYNIKFKSFVFPKNEIAYVDILKKNGFRIYRGKTITYSKKNKYLIFKNLKNPIENIIGYNFNIIPEGIEPIWMEGIWEIQGSMFFCDSVIPHSLLPRTKLGIINAINHNKIFHIWFHPWNLVYYKRLKDNLEKLLKFISKKREKNELEVITMGELAKKII